MSELKAKMQTASQLIKQKQYDKARAILETVDHPKAREWLQKLDQIAPAQPAYTRGMFAEPDESPDSDDISARIGQTSQQDQSKLISDIAYEEELARLREQNKKTRRKKRGWGCWVRSCLSLTFMSCSAYMIIPLLAVVSGLMGIDIPVLQQASQQIETFSETSPVGRQIEKVTDRSMTFTMNQMEPQLINVVDSNCESQGTDAQAISYCKEIGRDMIDCFQETGGDIEICINRIQNQVCSQYTGQNRDLCNQQFEDALGDF